MMKNIKIVGIILVFTGLMVTPCLASDSTRLDAVMASDCSTMHLDDPGTLSGYVTDTEMNPLEGALIRVYFHETYRENYSDATGYYHVTDIPLCYCMKNATCSKPGHISAWVLLAITENTTHDFILESTGPWLYVGGSGPGNYTKIQDAIDNASTGDTVFVYDDSSPYVENIFVDVSITLLGEEKNTTIVNGSTNGTGENLIECFGLWISADNVAVSGFTVEGGNLSGIVISSNHTSISNTILSHNHNYGITMGALNISQPYGLSGYNTITNCLITNNGIGVWVSGHHNSITGNVITQNEMGIIVMFSLNSNISHNIISNSGTGVYLSGSYHTVIYRNNLSHNDDGVNTMWISGDRILQNNFIGNNESASTAQMFFIQLYYKFKGEISYPLRRSIWKENYWDKPRSHPYKSPGLLWFFIDWHPAQAPYPIEG
jgi:parallel beta-helix repeat protein